MSEETQVQTEAEPAYPSAGAVPAPGVYRHVPFNVYISWTAAMNSSSLKRGLKSMRKLHKTLNRLDGEKDTASMAFGRALHDYLLDQTAFHRDYTIEDVSRRSAAGKARWQEIVDSGKQHLRATGPESDPGFEGVQAAADNLASDEYVRELIDGEGDCELSIVWIDDVTGLLCKARIDKLIGQIPHDLKSTKCAEIESFTKDADKFGYYLSAAWYLRGLKAVGLIPPDAWHWHWVVVENTAPYETASYYADQTIIQQADSLNMALLKKYARCIDAGKFPGYNDGLPAELPTPAWSPIKRHADGFLLPDEETQGAEESAASIMADL